jgi:hypothetical protein
MMEIAKANTKWDCSSSVRATVAGWDKVFNEMKKCALLCCRCHQEVEYGLIDSLEMEGIYKEKWNKINLGC